MMQLPPSDESQPCQARMAGLIYDGLHVTAETIAECDLQRGHDGPHYGYLRSGTDEGRPITWETP